MVKNVTNGAKMERKQWKWTVGAFQHSARRRGLGGKFWWSSWKMEFSNCLFLSFLFVWTSKSSLFISFHLFSCIEAKIYSSHNYKAKCWSLLLIASFCRTVFVSSNKMSDSDDVSLPSDTDSEEERRRDSHKKPSPLRWYFELIVLFVQQAMF